MSGQLVPGEVRGRLELIRRETESAAEVAVNASLELGSHIEWQAGEIERLTDENTDLTNRISELTAELAAYEEED